MDEKSDHFCVEISLLNLNEFLRFRLKTSYRIFKNEGKKNIFDIFKIFASKYILISTVYPVLLKNSN